jgi:hypothetical protein
LNVIFWAAELLKVLVHTSRNCVRPIRGCTFGCRGNTNNMTQIHIPDLWQVTNPHPCHCKVLQNYIHTVHNRHVVRCDRCGTLLCNTDCVRQCPMCALLRGTASVPYALLPWHHCHRPLAIWTVGHCHASPGEVHRVLGQGDTRFLFCWWAHIQGSGGKRQVHEGKKSSKLTWLQWASGQWCVSSYLSYSLRQIIIVRWRVDFVNMSTNYRLRANRKPKRHQEPAVREWTTLATGV